MVNIKIILDEDETPEIGEEKLFKALNSQRTGEVHTDDFEDPAVRDSITKMANIHKTTIENILKEIFDELNKEYSSDY